MDIKKELECIRLEDRVLFEAAAAAEIAEAQENDPNADMNAADQEAQAEKNAPKNAPAVNPADSNGTPDDPAAIPQPEDVADIDAQIQSLIEGEIGAPADGMEAIDKMIADTFNDFGANAVDETIQDAFAEPGVDELQVAAAHSDVNVSVETEQELVVINSSVQDRDQIIDALGANQEVLVLEPGKDAMQQINDYLDVSGKEYSAIHIVSHGNTGYITLAGARFDSSNFAAADWTAIGEHLTDGGDILFYGCNLAENQAGQDFIAMVADASGADVAASTDATGISGNWTLEYQVGVLETTAISVSGYDRDLDSVDVDNFDKLKFNVESTSYEEIIITQDITFSGTITVNRSLSIFSEAGERYTLYAGTTTMFSITSGDVSFDNLIFDGKGTSQIMQINSNATVELTGITMENGNAIWGGAIYSNGGKLTITDSTFSNNRASGSGGAIYSNGGTLSIEATTISGNTTNAYGGGIYSNGSTLSIEGTTISNNSAGNDGGGIYSNGGTLTIDGGSISNNTAEDSGGGIYATATLTIGGGAMFDGNKVTKGTGNDGGGGAIWMGSNGTLTVTYATFINNTSTDGSGKGGAIYNAGAATIYNSTFYNNSAEQGGAIFNEGTMTLADATLTANHAKQGGGLYLNSNSTYVLNTLMLGNYLKGDVEEQNDIKIAGGSNLLRIAYSLYGVIDGNFRGTGNTQITGDIDHSLAEIFGAKWQGTELVLLDGSPIMRPDGTIAITSTGQAAYSGTLVGYDASDRFYFRHGNNWAYLNATGQVVTASPFDQDATNFGLNGTVIRLGQNLPASRVDTHIAYNAGAYVIGKGSAPELPSVVVTTNSDIINPFDYEISLREAVEVYAGLVVPNGFYFDTISRKVVVITASNPHTVGTDITFNLIHASSSIITLDQRKGTIDIDKNLTINGHDIKSGENVTVQMEGTSHRLFAADNTAKDWTLAFSNINLKDGNAGTGDGGALYVSGQKVDLTLDNVTVFDSRGANGGGVAVNATVAGGTLTVTHSEFRGNEATTAGGALYATGVTVKMDNSLFVQNEAAATGGAIHLTSAVTGTLTNLTIAANTAAQRGGGGIWGGAGITVQNSILWGNTGRQFRGLDRGQFYNSAIQGWRGGTANGNIRLQNDNHGANGIDANDNATGVYYVCFTADYQLGKGSYVINRGNNTYATSATDLGGNTRILRETVDMGAYESADRGNVVLSVDNTRITYGETETLEAKQDGHGKDDFRYISSDLDYLKIENDQATAWKAGKDVNVLVEYLGDNNWREHSTTMVVTTEQREITLTALGGDYTYDGTSHKFTWDGKPGGDKFAFDDDLTSYEANSYRDAGKYEKEVLSAIVISSAKRGPVNENYKITYGEGIMNIAQATLTITSDSDKFTYDGTYHDFAYTKSGLVKGDYIYAIVNGENSYRNAGSYTNTQSDAVIYNTDGKDMSTNYAITYKAGTVTIDKATLTITSDSGNFTYDGTYHDFSYTKTDLVKGDYIFSIVNGENSYRDAGSYTDTQSDAMIYNANREDMSDNYSITYKSGTVTIDKATLTITSDSGNFTYDGTYHDFSYTKTDLVKGDYIFSIVNGQNSYRNAGSYTDTQSDAVIYNANDEDMSANYDITYKAGTVTIDKATLTITVDAGQSKVYGADDPTFKYSASGLVTGDSLTGELSRMAGEDIGLYAILNTLVLADGNGGDNYNVDYKGQNFEITQATLTITSDSGNFTYDGTYHDFSYTKSDLAKGDYIYSIVNGENSYRNAGSYTDTQSDAIIYNASGKNVSANYSITYKSGTVTIDKATLTITSDSGNFTYDGTYHDFMYDEKGLAIGDYIFSIVNGENSYRNAGSYTDTQSDAVIYNANREDMSTNYSITYKSGTVTVDKATLTITSDSGNFTYDGTYHDFSYTKSGLAKGDYIDSIVNGQNSYRNAGSYTDTQSDAVIYNAGGEDMSANYSITYKAGTVTIDKATLTITVDAGQGKVYGTDDPTFKYSVNGLADGDSMSGALSREAGKDVGSYAINQNTLDVVTDGDNYDVIYNSNNFTITKATLIVNRNGQDKVYDGTTDADYTWSFDGLIDGDDVTYSEGDAAFTDKNAGQNKAITINGDSLDGEDLKNYDYSFKDVGADITKATLVVNRDGQDKVYDGTTDANYTWSLDDLIEGDDVSYNKGSAAFDDKNAGQDKAITISGDSLSGKDLANYEVIYGDSTGADITKADLLIVIDDQGKLVGEADPEFTGSTSGLMNGDSVSGYGRAARGEAPGKYAIDLYQVEDSNGGKNYNITVIEGTLTIAAVEPGAVSSNVFMDASSRRYTVNGMNQASLIDTMSTIQANRDMDAEVDAENAGNIHSVSHQTVAKADGKAKTNIREASHKRNIEAHDLHIADQKTNLLQVNTGQFTDSAEKNSIVESQHQTETRSAGGIQVAVPGAKPTNVSRVVTPTATGGYSLDFTGDASTHPLNATPSPININSSPYDVVTFSGGFANVTWVEKAENLKDKLDIILEDMIAV